MQFDFLAVLVVFFVFKLVVIFLLVVGGCEAFLLMPASCLELSLSF